MLDTPLQKTTALGAPILLAGLAVASIFIGPSGAFSAPGLFVFLCLLAAISFLAVGIAIIKGSLEVVASRPMTYAIALPYMALGSIGLLADLAVFGLMNACFICL